MAQPLIDDLQALVADYRPYDELESSHLDRLRMFMKAGDLSLFARTNPVGQITASAFVIDQSCMRTLLTHHAKLDRWLQFGGHIEDDADTAIAAAALREAEEESGIDGLALAESAIFDIDVHPIPESPHKNEPAHLHFDIRFLLIAPNDDFMINNESNEIRWCTIEEAALLLSYEPGLVRLLRKWRERQATFMPMA